MKEKPPLMVEFNADFVQRENPNYTPSDLRIDYFMPGTEHLKGRLQTDFSKVDELAALSGLKPNDLKHAAVIIEPHLGKGPNGYVSSCDALLHHDTNLMNYPLIHLCVKGDQPNMSKINTVFRHELKYLGQPNKLELPYNKPSVLRATRYIGGLSLIAGAAEYGYAIKYPGSAGMAGIWAGSASASFGTFAALTPYRFLHAFSPSEMDAHVFAYRYNSIWPVSIS